MPKKPKTNYASSPTQVNPQDCFQTPAYALDPLLPYLYARGLRCVWESAAGQGYLVRALESAGFCVESGDIQTGQNYFESEPDHYDVQVTNPPFALKYRWMARACELGKPFALLVPSDVLFAGQKAQPLIRRYGLELLIPDKRIDFKTPDQGWTGSSAQMHTSWLTYGLHLGQLVTFCTLHKRITNEGVLDAA
jgi:hypothetical protein